MKICCTEGPLSFGEMASHTGDPHVPVLMVCHTDSPHTPGKTVSHTGGPIFTSHIHGWGPGEILGSPFYGVPIFTIPNSTQSTYQRLKSLCYIPQVSDPWIMGNVYSLVLPTYGRYLYQTLTLGSLDKTLPFQTAWVITRVDLVR